MIPSSTSSLSNGIPPLNIRPFANDLPALDPKFAAELAAFPPAIPTGQGAVSPVPFEQMRSQSESKTQGPVGSKDLKKAFQDFVGQTFFTEMIKACRSGQQPAAYFNGGRAEEIFQGQLDQVLSEELSESSADKIADPMFELFMLKRQS